MENPSIVKKLLANIDLTIKSWHKAQLTFYTLGLAAIQNIFMRRVLKNFLGSRIYKVSSRLRLVSFSRFCYHFQYQFLFQSSPDFSRIFTTRSFPPFLRPYAFSAFLHFPSISCHDYHMTEIRYFWGIHKIQKHHWILNYHLRYKL